MPEQETTVHREWSVCRVCRWKLRWLGGRWFHVGWEGIHQDDDHEPEAVCDEGQENNGGD